ncbi:hypothetical protein G7054_g11647 [Neopestalotiopsis clavispora]|nr:hypothetical protein G7054_g11647 [Neopestalotiopsis clavispora]
MESTLRRSTGSSSIEEIERGDIQVLPQGSVEIIPPPILVNTSPWRFGMHAAAGAAAARVGADLNKATATSLVIQMGALAGATKAAMTSFREIVSLSSVNLVFRILLMLLTSSFGVCALLVTEVGNIVLGDTPKQLVIAAVVAAVPLIFEMIRNIQPVQDQDGKTEYYRWVYAIFLIPADALGGYVFARVAANQGMPISNYHAACSAGAVFGTLTWLSRALTGIVAMLQSSRDDGRHSNVFGVYELMQPDPIIVTEEEYLAMQRGIMAVLMSFFGSWPKMMQRYLSCLNCCCGCCFACFGIKGELEEMRQEMQTMERENREEMQDVGYQLAEQIMPPTRAS